MGVFSLRFVDLPQYTLVCLVQCFRQLFEHLPHARWKTVTKGFQLAIYPTKPVWRNENNDRTATGKVLTSHRLFERAYRSPISYPHLSIVASLDQSERLR